MNKSIVLAAGWVLAIVLGGALFMQVLANRDLTGQIAAAEANRNALEARLANLEHEHAELRRNLSATGEAAPAHMGAATESVEVPKGFDPAALLKNMLGGDKTETSKPKGEKPENPFAAMFEGEQGEAMIESMLPMQVDMQYSALFQDLNLPAERRAALRDALLEHARAGMAAGMSMMRGEGMPDGSAMPSEESLRAAIAEVLTPEELAQFDAYQEELPERMLRQQFDMQMNMFAGDLPEDIRATAVDIMVENLLEAGQTGMDMNPDFSAMRAAFDNTLADLGQVLSPEDFARVRPIIDQQRAGIDMAVRMMGLEEETEPAP
ncbi:MAG: hypothetical protein KF886_02015 [Candidatus Hydrogenedentes bacterium]|nr:hypothetical protein [Candidatus Hydrogenedentota bacterium]